MMGDWLLPLSPSGQPRPRAGAPSRGAPVPSFFWPALFALVVLVASGFPIKGDVPSALATTLMLAGGLPHGAYDIALASRTLRLSPRAAFTLLVAYVSVAGAMLLLWQAAPLVALALFLTLAAVHFGEDWQMLSSGLLRVMAGASIICIPAFFRPEEVAALFVEMAGPGANLLAHLAIACAPVALLVTLVGIMQAVQRKNVEWAAAQSSALAVLALLPPLIGFTLYFVFLHSPLHVRGLGHALAGWSRGRLWLYGALICGVCAIGGLLLIPGLMSGEGILMSAAGFRLLSVVAAPHLLLTLLVERQVTPSHPPR